RPLGLGQVLPREHRDDAVGLARLGRLDRGDACVGEGAAHHGQVEHPGELDVVRPAGASGDEALVLLAAPGPADLTRRLTCRCRSVLGDSHARTSSVAGSPAAGRPLPASAETPAPPLAPAACCTALTMLW